jgi:hypothetical protein
MTVPEVSANAKKLLKHFSDRKLGLQAYESPAAQQGLFTTIEDCLGAQLELEAAGLLELGPAESSVPVRTAALTREGVRWLATNPPP